MSILHWPSGKKEDSDIKPCPFCGSTELFANETWTNIECNKCGVSGPIPHRDDHSWEEAITLWNKREITQEQDLILSHCEIREHALYAIRKLVEPGSEISKIAGRALCYGSYTKK